MPRVLASVGIVTFGKNVGGGVTAAGLSRPTALGPSVLSPPPHDSNRIAAPPTAARLAADALRQPFATDRLPRSCPIDIRICRRPTPLRHDASPPPPQKADAALCHGRPRVTTP